MATNSTKRTKSANAQPEQRALDDIENLAVEALSKLQVATALVDDTLESECPTEEEVQRTLYLLRAARRNLQCVLDGVHKMQGAS